MNLAPARLQDRISLIEGRHREGETAVFCPDYGFDGGLHFLPIRGFARFWNEETDRGSLALELAHGRLVGGLWDAGKAWSMVIFGDSSEISLLFGFSGGRPFMDTHRRVLRGSLPRCEIGEALSIDLILPKLRQRTCVAAMTGNPVIAEERGEHGTASRFHGEGIDALVEVMRGSTWAYVLAAHPMDEDELRERVRALEVEEGEICEAFLRRGTAEENNNPTARRYLELVRVAHGKYAEGRQRGMWNTKVHLLADSRDALFAGMQCLAGAFGGSAGCPEPVRVRACVSSAPSCTSSVTRLTSREVAALSRPPSRELPGLEVRNAARFSVAAVAASRDPVAVGRVILEGEVSPSWFEIGRDDFAKNVLVVGVPGGGKTLTCQYLLRQLWEEHGVPWLVLEPSIKSEYRRLLRSPLGGDLRIFTLANEGCVPFRFNPLEVLPGIPVQAHIDGLLAVLNAGFAWVTPTPVVLAHAVHRLYQDFGWDLVLGSHPLGHTSGTQPTMMDLIARVPAAVEELGYESEVSGNLRAALLTRLSSLTLGAKGRMLGGGAMSVSMEQLLGKPTVLEFSAVGSDEEKAFLLGALLLRLAQYRQVQGVGGEGLRHVTLIEEAHRVLRAAPLAEAGEANPRGMAVDAIARLLDEMRAFGEGMVISDQIPSRLAPEAVKNTNLKIVHRLVSAEDRALLAGSMNMDMAQERHLATLNPGEAVTYREGTLQPSLVAVPNHAHRLGFDGIHPSPAEVRSHMLDCMPSLLEGTPSAVATSERAALPDCPGLCTDGCRMRGAILRELLHVDHSRDYALALEDGFEALWSFGSRVAQRAFVPSPPPPEAPYCVAMNLCVIARHTEADTARIREGMQELRNARVALGHSPTPSLPFGYALRPSPLMRDTECLSQNGLPR